MFRSLCFVLLSLSAVWAQVDRAGISVTIADSTGAVVVGAKVEAVSQSTGLRRAGLTGSTGNYSFAQLAIGAYTITVTSPGFRGVTMKDVNLGVGDNRTLDLQLEVSSVESSVTVETVLSPLDSNSAVVGTVIGASQVREMPLNGRHWASLMALAPGAINTGDGSQQTIRFVGRARDDNNWTFDGVDSTGVKDPRQEAALRLVISTDSIAEFRVNTTLYSAESGGGAGGQVNLVSRSGSNDFRGSLFEFFRNDKMDARNPFDNAKQPFRLNQFGGNFGGPVIRNRTFFFGNYEGLQQRVSQTFTNDVPSAAYRLRATNSAIRPILDAYPAGTIRTTNADIDRVQGDRSQKWTENAASFRVDHRLNDSNTFYARYNFDDGTIIAPRTLMTNDYQDSKFLPSNLAVQYQRVFSPTIVNELKAGVNRSVLRRESFGPIPASIAVAGFTTINQPSLLIEAGTSIALIDNLAINRGSHTLKFGGEIRGARVNVADPAVDTVGVTYADRNTFLANRVDSVGITGGSAVLGTRKTYYFAYVQDDYKITPTLTLNLGLRYEYYGVNREVNNRYRVFDLNECKGFCPQGTPWYFPDRNNFDPRLGFAWSPSALKGRTVIRGGVGIYHGPGQIDDVNTALDNVAERLSLTANEAPNLAYPVGTFLQQARTQGVTPRSLQRDRRDLYSAQWGLSIQQKLVAGFLMQVGYNASSGVKLFARQYINNLDPITKVRPLPAFGRLDEKRQDGKSNFHALQVSLHRRVGRGVTWGTEYMWSHSINDGNLGGGEGAQPQIAVCRRCDRGNSAQDIRHTITSHWTYVLPFGKGQAHLTTGVASKLFGGWETSGIWTARTGRNMTIGIARATADAPDGNTSGQRPNIVPGVSLYPSGPRSFTNWLNPAAFAIPARGAWGNAGRAIAVGPGLVQIDMTLQRRIALAEKKELVFRIESFNLANRIQANNPGSTLTSPASFGLVTTGLNRTIGTGTSRQLQLALRLNF